MSTPDDDLKITAAGGWCAPMETVYDLPAFTAQRGGITYPSAEELAETQARLERWRHENRWKRRRAHVRSWLTLRPVRNRIHNHIHRNCEDY